MLVPHLVFNLASTKDSPILSEILTFTLRQLELLLGLLQGIWARWGLSSLPKHPGLTKWACRGLGKREWSQWPYPDDHMTWLLSLSCQYVSGLSQRLQMGIARRWKMPHLYSSCQRDIKWPLSQNFHHNSGSTCPPSQRALNGSGTGDARNQIFR